MILKKTYIVIVYLFSFIFLLNQSLAVEPDEILANQQQENLARKISKNIRCMVCQNQSIDESSSEIAKDLRILIRNKITNGNTEKEIYIFLSNRYGDFILLKPRVKLNTLALWFLPFIFLFVGIFIIYLHNKKSKKIL